MNWQVSQLARIKVRGSNGYYYIHVSSIHTVDGIARGIGFDHLDLVAIGYTPLELIEETRFYNKLIDIKLEQLC